MNRRVIITDGLERKVGMGARKRRKEKERKGSKLRREAEITPSDSRYARLELCPVILQEAWAGNC
jgi:hypothetical protein